MIDTQECFSRNPHPSVDLKKWQTTVNLMSQLFDTKAGLIVQFRQGEFNVVGASENPDNFLGRNDSWPWEMKSFCRRIMETGKGLYVANADEQAEWKDAPPVCDGPVRSYYGLPLMWPDQTLFGTICCIDTQHTGYNDTQLQLLEQFRELINSDLKLIFNFEEIKTLALTDEMTQVSNRRGLNVLGEQRIKDACRFNQQIGVVYIDIDDMKLLNDNYGHHCGDECITTLALVLKDCSRDNDIIARVGGDEFLVMLLVDDEADMQQFCQRLDLAFSDLISNSTALQHNSLSYGYVITDSSAEIDLEALISEADRRMYENKRLNKLQRSAS